MYNNYTVMEKNTSLLGQIWEYVSEVVHDLNACKQVTDENEIPQLNLKFIIKAYLDIKQSNW